LDDAAEDAIHSEHGADTAAVEAETATEFEGEVGVLFGGDLGWVVQEDGQKLVVGYGVEGQEGVGY
jgi:hypothetical protein